MLETKEISDLRSVIASWKSEGLKVAFVPTMGALHQGHLSLIELAAAKSDRVVCSIFVNPTQFNDPEDFLKYPRTVQKDLALLGKVPCDLVFLPDSAEMYPEGTGTKAIDFGDLTHVLEAEHRAGHFEGVVAVVGRLFDAVDPDLAIFGEKDYQQLAIIREMSRREGRTLEIIGAPIVREDSGLAMSSRNERLSPEGRMRAAHIYRCLFACQQRRSELNPRELEELGQELLAKEPALLAEYFAVIDEDSWKTPESFESGKQYRLLCAVWCEGIRLIDNLALQHS